MTEKTIRIKMKGGKTRLQRVKVLASGKYRFIKNLHHSRSSSARVKTVKTKSRSHKMGKGKKKGGHRSFTLPVAPIAGAVGTFATQAPSGRSLISDISSGNYSGLLYDAKEIFTGVDNTGRIRADWLLKTYAPLAVGLGVHIVASKLGLNRLLGRAKVPVLRV